MKILFITPSAQLGGAERMLIDLIASLREQDAHVLALEDGPLVEIIQNLGAPVIVAPMPSSLARVGDGDRLSFKLITVLPYVLRLRRIVAKIQPDVIHANGIKAQLLSRFIAGDAKVFWHVHDFLGNRTGAKKLLRMFSSRVDCAIAVSNAVERDVRESLPNVLTKTLLNAIDTDHFCPGHARSSSLDRLAGFEPQSEAIRIGLVATYGRWKGHDIFIDAAAHAIHSAPAVPLRFFIVGGPIYSTRGSQFTRAQMSDRIARAGISDRVGFVEFQNDPREIYRALDIVVHASTSPEPFGRTIVEAMACGRPVIATRGGGTAEIITNGIDGLLIEPKDPAMLAKSILQLASDPLLRASLSTAARATAVNRFDRARLGPALLEIYSQSSRSGDKSRVIR